MPDEIVNRIFVIGCDSVRLTAGGIQIRAATGLMRIAWREVKAAAVAGRDRQTAQMPAGLAEQLTHAEAETPEMSAQISNMFQMMELQATHDPLWIVLQGQIIYVLVEPSGPARDALLAGLGTGLGARWLGEDFAGEQLEKRFCPMGLRRRLRVIRLVIEVLSALVVFMIVSTVVMYGLPILTGELVVGTIQALLMGEWEAALIIAGASVACLLVCFFANRAIRARMRGLWPGS